MKKRLMVLAIALVLVVGLGAVRLKRMRQKNAAPLLVSVPMAVQTAPADTGTVSTVRHLLGEVIGGDEVQVAPRVMARVLNIMVRQGSVVTKGQVLATLDDREQQDGFDAAEAALGAARIAARTRADATARDSILFEAKAISQEQWDRSRTLEAALNAKLVAAEKDLKRAETRLSYTRVSAPVDGVVADRLVDPGDLAVPGKPMIDIVNQTNVRVRGKLPQEDLPRLAPGQSLTLAAGETNCTARVTRVFPATDANHLAVFEADLDSPPATFVAGLTVGIDISLASSTGISVPTSALLEGDNGTWVFRVEKQRIEPVRVDVLAAGGGRVVVRGDLAVGDQVVIARPSRLMTLTVGQEVRTTPQGGRQ